MTMVSNAQKLAAVLSKWARPAISQLASGKLMQLPMLQSLQATICGSGIVGQGYSLASDITPFVQPIVNSIIKPMLEKYIGNIPDDAIPATARAVVDQMLQQGTYTILDGLVTFEETDILELDELLKRNLPVVQTCEYEVI